MAKRDPVQTSDPAQIEQLIQRVKQGTLAQEDTELIERLLRLVLSLLSLLQQKNTSIKRLKRLLFGGGSDQRQARRPAPLADPENPAATQTEPPSPATPTEVATATPQAETFPAAPSSRKKRGHGRRPAAAYTGAQVVPLAHPQLKPGDHCPDPLCTGHLYALKKPSPTLRLSGQPLVGATRYERQVLRCSACQERFRAALPAGVGATKYDVTADVALALAKYGAGLPFYRLAQLQESYGVPLPASVQFERCEAVADAALPVFRQLRNLAANGEVLYMDDTRVKILACLQADAARPDEAARTTQTSGIVVQVGARKIALYASGRQHAGENLTALLQQRSANLGPPIQMADALAANWSGTAETIAAKCLAHARRKFIELEANFPQACQVVLDAIAQVYRNEAATAQLSAAARLTYHQATSGPVLTQLRAWIEQQFAARQVEPNSGLGQALRYVLKHWEGLTKFLSVAQAPLDNNEAERALKRCVLLRKNALFYKNEHGAAIGDILLSLIETCRLNQVSAWHYLIWLRQNPAAVRQNPAAALPWNYTRGAPAATRADEARAA